MSFWMKQPAKNVVINNEGVAMENYLNAMKEYWDGRFADEGKIWGIEPSITAASALTIFRRNNVHKILIPGSGYGRNSKLFSEAGFTVTGIEISTNAFLLAQKYDPITTFYCDSFSNMPLKVEEYCAVYCFNVLHLFRHSDRMRFMDKCYHSLKKGGITFFAVFSELEKSFGKGSQVEENTFESKLGRPVHYFTEQDLQAHFSLFTILETGIAEDRENHGEFALERQNFGARNF